MVKTLGIGLLLLLFVWAAGSWAAPAVYQNPVFEPVFADPSIIRAEDGWFYAYGTEDDWGDGRGSRLMPILRSIDLVNWTYVGDVFNSKPDWKAQGYLWAPDIHYRDGHYLLYYAYSVWGDPDPGIGVATAASPTGPFTDHGPLFMSTEIGVANSIDPFLFVDDGTPYLFWGSFHGIFGVELTPDGLSVAGDPFPLVGRAFEAAYIIERYGYYYFFGSLGACCEGDRSSYHVSVGRSETLHGPYRDELGFDLFFSSVTHGRLLLIGHGEQKDGKRFVGPGHVSVIRDDAGTDWLLYHAVDVEQPWLPNGATRRPLLLDAIVWLDGWPTIPGMVPSTKPQPAPVIRGVHDE